MAAQGADVVLVLDPESKLAAGFVSALQIELGDKYRVSVAAQAIPQPLPERIAHATALVESERALATVWIEDASATQKPPSALLYVVGRREGRALLEVVQAPDARGLDLERMLSIKLAELLLQLKAAPVHPLEPEPEPEPEPDSRQPEAASQLWGAMSLGPRFDVGLGTGWSRFGVAAALAPELSFGSIRVALGLGLDVYPSLKVRENSSEVTLSEVDPRLFAGLSWFTPALALAFQTGPTWNIMSVHGRTPAGYEDGATVSGLGWSFAFSAERSFTSTLALGARVELHTTAQRLHFDVNDQQVLDRGRLRLAIGIDLTFRTPITAASP